MNNVNGWGGGHDQIIHINLRIVSLILYKFRFDNINHWVAGNELDGKGHAKRRNCRQCTIDGHKDNKTVYQCEKCEMPLHIHCFKDRIHCFSFYRNYFKDYFFPTYLYSRGLNMVSFFYFYAQIFQKIVKFVG